MEYFKKRWESTAENTAENNSLLNSSDDTTTTPSSDNSMFSNFGGSVSSFFSDVSNTISTTYDNVATSALNTYEEGLESLSNFADTTEIWTSDFKEKLITYKTNSLNAYDQIEIKSNLLGIVSSLDCEKIALSLEKLKRNDLRIDSAISITQQIILTLHKYDKILKESNEEVNDDMSLILKSIDIKSVVAIMEPFAILIPYGATVIYILKLFVY